MDPRRAGDQDLAFLSGGGDLGTLMREHPWERTTLGPLHAWPLSLKTTLQLVLSSRFAMWMAWGNELAFFCNEAYRPTLGKKKGWLGARCDQVWEENWQDIGPRIDHVLRSGVATWDEGQLLFLERDDSAEETYHTFSYSPLVDDDGTTNGMLCVVTEETKRVIADRRLRVLHDLALRMKAPRTSTQIWAALTECLHREAKDIPFAIAYRFDDDGLGASLVAAHGARAQSGIAAERLERASPGPWPIFPLYDGTTCDGEMDLSPFGADLLSGPWDKTVTRALLLPILEAGASHPTGVLIAGINPYRKLDADYRVFLDLVVGQIASALASVKALAAARERAGFSRRALDETRDTQLAERTRQRDRAWNNVRDLLIVIDRTGVIHAVNPAWSSVLGYVGTDLTGTNVLDLVDAGDRERSANAMGHASSSLPPIFANRLRHRDGSSRSIAWAAAHEDDLIYASGRDVTHEKEASLQLEATQAQLRQAQKMEAVGQLTGGLAHDFNNLLTGISGSLEMLQMRLLKGEVTNVDRYVNAAQGAAKRAASLTHRLLAFSRRQTLDPRPTDVNRLVRDMEELIRRTVGPDVTVEVVGLSGAWTTRVDANQLENALLNLCINARDAMPHGGRLTIETANRWLDGRAATERDVPSGQYLSLSVSDTGTGMTHDVARRIFDPFFTTKPLGVGTGLGLSMVYGFARQSGGQVRVYSEVGSGTTMTMYLPRHFGEVEHDVPVEQRANEATNPDGLTVLVVDDEATVRALVSEILGESGYRVIEAVDGAAGLRVLQSDERVDLLITDVGLPGGMNGRQVADAGRSLRPDLKILFITGYAENAVVGNGHLDPGMQILTKPFTMDALASRVDTMARSR